MKVPIALVGLMLLAAALTGYLSRPLISTLLLEVEYADMHGAWECAEAGQFFLAHKQPDGLVVGRCYIVAD